MDRRSMLTLTSALAGTAAFGRLATAATPAAPPSAAAASAVRPGDGLRVARFIDADSVELTEAGALAIVRRGGRHGAWQLMEIVAGERGFVVLEDFTRLTGRLLFVDELGVRLDLGKTAESTAGGDTRDFLGLTEQQVHDSPRDLLAEAMLRGGGDPDYAEVARAFPPLRRFAADCYSFIGTPDTQDKIGFSYGGRTANFDPAVYQPSIEAIVKRGEVWNGLVGGHLPVLRFVYPEANGDWTEYLAFAPLRTVNGNPRFQPVWYRVSRIEGGALTWSRHFDSFHPFPWRPHDDPRSFYRDLAALQAGWDRILQPAMAIELPDARMADLARFSLVRAMMSRSAGYPKYGAVEKNYAGSEHDGFPDTFTVETEALCEWGLFERAGQAIENYFLQYVTDDGSILYRGPETGQYGRMLTVVAQYFANGGNADVLLRCRGRIDAVARLLLALRAQALRRGADDQAYGMIAGWSEADSCLEKDPERYVQPYFSNSSEAARGWRDLGRAWQAIGAQRAEPELVRWGEQLQREAESLRRDLAAAIARSTLVVEGEAILPAIAGVREPEHIAVPRDLLDPQYRGYRAYMEMLHSGNLGAQQVARVADYRANHFDTLLAVPTAYAYNTREMAGFLSYGHGYGLIQIDRIREALLLTYSLMAHQYTRGTWMAPETRRPMSSDECAPYASPAQLAVPLLLRWLLVFEDPESEVLWLGKGLPRTWLASGQAVRVRTAPTHWGHVGFALAADARGVTALLSLPAAGIAAETRLRLRAPQGARLRSVSVNGRPWRQFDAAGEFIALPAHTPGELRVEAVFSRSG